MVFIIIIFIMIILLIVLILFRDFYYLYHMKNKIFPRYIDDIIIKYPEDDNIYYEVLNLLKDKTYTTNDIIFLMKYKKYVTQKDIYSMGAKNEIDLMEECIKTIVNEKIEGDIIEAGVWKGGMGMWIQNLLNYYNDKRTLWLFDTYGKFPESSYDKDRKIHPITEYLFSEKYNINDVKINFEKFNLLDNNIKFIIGEFKNTIPITDISKISILRLDSDYYDSTMLILEKYYNNISKGGYVIIDDYNNEYLAAKEAINDFRKKYNIKNPIINKGYGYVYWRIM